MNNIDYPSVRQLETRPTGASPPPGKTARRPYRIAALAPRLVAIALLSRVVWIHLHLWQSGYKHIPTVGPLFLAGALAVLVVTAALLARPNRPLGLLALALDAGILASLIGTINFGLFGFTESLHAPYVTESIVIETLAGVVLALWVAVARIAHPAPTDRDSSAVPIDDVVSLHPGAAIPEATGRRRS